MNSEYNIWYDKEAAIDAAKKEHKRYVYELSAGRWYVTSQQYSHAVVYQGW